VTDELCTARRLSAAVLAVSDRLTVPEVLQTIVDTARELVGAQYAALGVPDDDGSFAEFLVSGVSDEMRAAIGPLPRQHGFLALMLCDPEAQRVADIRADPRFGWWPEAHPVLEAFLGVPVANGDEILGALYLANKPGGFTESDEELVGVLAAHAAIALTHARLYARNRELTIAEERARIAHDLHDAVAQRLFGLRLTAEAAGLLLDRDPAAARERLAEVSTLAREATEELHAAVLEVSDDGAGFDIGAVLRAGRSLGLRSLRERAHSVKGTATVRSTAGAGTVVRLEVPGG
jgi:signal transduction histidine kinase